ncbi:hypothetical protein [Humibacter ginsenosidimutans]|uniref:hypothetical protein n=1 Tax=Humibacter ginsenosidimutans TaxID=2599293 RepID=UPI001FEFD36E|nr:hypothetical protein [Humibacter ginsenosidimutans]
MTTNSATLVNKGLEVIEAHLLSGVPVRQHRGGGASAAQVHPLDGWSSSTAPSSPSSAC